MSLQLTAPTSKSMTQRALVIAALCEGQTTIERPLHCDDSRYLIGALRAMGCEVTSTETRLDITPAQLVAPQEPVFCGNAGTAVRFGSCLSLICDGVLTVDGNEHMRKRPIGPLGTCLEQMGLRVTYLERDGCPPLRLERRSEPPASTSIDTSLSSQYASGLLMVAPRLAQGLSLELSGALVSMPYVDMTVAMMRRAGAQIERRGRSIVVATGGYRSTSPQTLVIEPDWSAAAFVLAAARIAAIDIEVVDLPSPSASLQGDAAFVDMLATLDRSPVDGCYQFDLTDAPDLIAPLTAACLFAAAPSRIRGAAHTRVKECDRVAVLCTELSKLGAKLTMHDDGLDIEPLAQPPRGQWSLDPADDHRMAMTFGLVSLRVDGIEVQSPACVGKSFPDFWDVLAQIRAAM